MLIAVAFCQGHLEQLRWAEYRIDGVDPRRGLDGTDAVSAAHFSAVSAGCASAWLHRPDGKCPLTLAIKQDPLTSLSVAAGPFLEAFHDSSHTILQLVRFADDGDPYRLFVFGFSDALPPSLGEPVRSGTGWSMAGDSGEPSPRPAKTLQRSPQCSEPLCV